MSFTTKYYIKDTRDPNSKERIYEAFFGIWGLLTEVDAINLPGQDVSRIERQLNWGMRVFIGHYAVRKELA